MYITIIFNLFLSCVSLITDYNEPTMASLQILKRVKKYIIQKFSKN